MSAPDSSRFRWWIDTPATVAVPSRRVMLGGWVYARDGGAITGVRLRRGWRRVQASYGQSRPDVLAAFGHETQSSGTGFTCALFLPPGLSEWTLEAALPDGTHTPLTELRFSAPADNALRDRLRWLRFWWRAWRGDPRGWELLTSDERGFLLAWARQRGWLTIGEFRQYPPRPVAHETFPRRRPRPATALPRFAIVTPSFNQARYLEATARGILSQEGVRLDYRVQDGGSRDDSAAVLTRLSSVFPDTALRRFSWVSSPDRGQSDAISAGFRHLPGEQDDILAYVNSDDLLMPGALAFVGDYFARHPEVDAVYGHRILIDAEGLEVGRWTSPRRACDDLRHQDLIPQETLFWRRRLWDRVGGIDPSFQFALDWDLLLRFEAAGARIVRLPWFLGLFRLHAEQKTQAWMEKHGIPEMDRLRERALGRPPSPEDLSRSMQLAQFDSALVFGLLKRGIRI